jgi:hypothetical protein
MNNTLWEALRALERRVAPIVFHQLKPTHDAAAALMPPAA